MSKLLMKVSCGTSIGAATDASGNTCASEMSDQEHYATYQSAHTGGDNSDMPTFPYLDDLHQYEYARKDSRPLTNTTSMSPNREDTRHTCDATLYHPNASMHSNVSMHSQSNMYFPLSNVDSAGVQPLPLFQGRWVNTRSHGAEASNALGHHQQQERPALASPRASASAPKRGAAAAPQNDEEEADAPPRKQARLTGVLPVLNERSTFLHTWLPPYACNGALFR